MPNERNCPWCGQWFWDNEHECEAPTPSCPICGEMENQIKRITTAIYSEELRCSYTVGQTMSGEWFFHWGAGIGAGMGIPNELIHDPENIRGAMVGRKEVVRREIEDCFFDPDPASWQGIEDQQEAAEVVVAALLRGLEEAGEILRPPRCSG